LTAKGKDNKSKPPQTGGRALRGKTEIKDFRHIHVHSQQLLLCTSSSKPIQTYPSHQGYPQRSWEKERANIRLYSGAEMLMDGFVEKDVLLCSNKKDVMLG
jgi:hypothetical protein